MANPNDGTQLGTSEVISDEYIDPAQIGRRDPSLPATAYKAPRSKIVVGPYGQDWGDATHEQPLAVESRAQRQLAELTAIREREQGVEMLSKSSTEYISMVDQRGHHISNRGTR